MREEDERPAPINKICLIKGLRIECEGRGFCIRLNRPLGNEMISELTPF